MAVIHPEKCGCWNNTCFSTSHAHQLREVTSIFQQIPHLELRSLILVTLLTLSNELTALILLHIGSFEVSLNKRAWCCWTNLFHQQKTWSDLRGQHIFQQKHNFTMKLIKHLAILQQKWLNYTKGELSNIQRKKKLWGCGVSLAGDIKGWSSDPLCFLPTWPILGLSDPKKKGLGSVEMPSWLFPS